MPTISIHSRQSSPKPNSRNSKNRALLFCSLCCSSPEGCQSKLCPSPKQYYHTWPSALGAPQSSHRGSYPQFGEWSSSTSDRHERNGNGMSWFSTLRTAFSRLWSHKYSAILTVNNSYQLLVWVGWVCGWAGLFVLYLHCNRSLLYCNISLQTSRQSPIVTTTALLHNVLLYYLPKVATAQHSDAVKILELNCPFPAEKQRRDSIQEMHEQITKDCVFVSREEALYSKKESNQLCQPPLT